MENTEKIENVEDLKLYSTRILVKVKEIKQGAIHIPDDVLQKQKDLITSGTFVKAGPVAFSDLVNTNKSIKNQIPHEGDKVFFVKYAGKALIIGGHDYRVMQDDDLFAGIDKENIDG